MKGLKRKSSEKEKNIVQGHEEEESNRGEEMKLRRERRN
jgi:hypothetical protein